MLRSPFQSNLARTLLGGVRHLIRFETEYYARPLTGVTVHIDVPALSFTNSFDQGKPNARTCWALGTVETALKDVRKLLRCDTGAGVLEYYPVRLQSDQNPAPLGVVKSIAHQIPKRDVQDRRWHEQGGICSALDGQLHFLSG